MVTPQAETLDPSPGRLWRVTVDALRPHHWVKNSLLFVPLLLAHEVMALDKIGTTLVAFLAFCACASSSYLLNDLIDRDADRKHPRRRLRPIASGALSLRGARLACAAMFALGMGLSISFLPLATTAMLVLYLALSTAYSLYFKKQSLLDVLLLAGLYTHRVLTGAVAASVSVSTWLLAFSMFFFLSLALLKRYVELCGARARQVKRLEGRGYEVDDIELVQSMGISSGFLSILVIGLYVSSSDVSRLYPTPTLLWLICPVMLYWISRIWLLARRGMIPDDPVLFAVRDPNSYVSGVLIVLIGGLATLW